MDTSEAHAQISESKNLLLRKIFDQRQPQKYRKKQNQEEEKNNPWQCEQREKQKQVQKSIDQEGVEL